MAIQIIPPQAEALEGLASVMVSRTANPSFTAAYANLTFDVTDIEIDPLIVEHNNTNTDRVEIKSDGVYAISYNMSALVTADLVVHSARVRVSDSTVVPQSEQQAKPLDTQEVVLNNTIVAELLTGDYVSLQIKGDTGTTAVKVNFSVTALSGIKGDEGETGAQGIQGAQGDPGAQGIQGDPGPQGPAGSGTSLNAQDEGVDVTGTPHSKYNFTGAGITATDQGGGILKVDVPVDHTHANLTELDLLTDGDHDVRTDNPHIVTLAQLGAAPVVHTHVELDVTDLDHDAQKIKGVVVDDTDKADGKILKFNATSGKLEYEIDETGGGGGGITGGLGGYVLDEVSAPFRETGSTSYVVFNRFIFAGTTALGTPTKIQIIGQVKQAAKTGSVRVFDLTSGLVIAETVDGLDTETPKIIDMGTLSNLPTGQAIWEIQLKNSTGTSTGKTQIGYLEILF